MLNENSYLNTYRLLFVNFFLVSLIIIAFMFGYVTPFYKNDLSHLTYLMTLIVSVNVFLAIKDSYTNDSKGFKASSEARRWLDWISGVVLYIGLCGTLIGFGHLLLSMDSAADIPTVIQNMKSGGLTLANSTLFGIIAWIWLNLNSYLVGDE